MSVTTRSLLPTLALATSALLMFTGCPPQGPVADGDAAADSADGTGASADGIADESSADGGSDGASAVGAIDPAVARQAQREAVRFADDVKFDEPAGITYAGGMLYIADTNNHEIRVIDLNDGERTGTFVVKGLKPPKVPPEPMPAPMPSADSEEEEPEPDAPEVATVDEDDPRQATPRPPAPEGDEDILDPAFPFRGKFAWDELEIELPQEPDKWLNTDEPLKVSQFKGKFVMLDFWTYCCINCIHILPEIKKLERKYANELVVIGVHSAKFETEKETENVEEAVLRYEIEHPVVNDVGSTVWNHLGVNSWPTVMLIDPDGNLVFVQKAEWVFEDMDHVIQTALPYYRDRGVVDDTPVKFALLRDKQKPKPLNFPGKVLADEATNRLFIADSNNNRVVISSLGGELIGVIGTGAIGQDDGGYDTATFNKPQGMALLEETLYVADTENHLIRKIDLKEKSVATIAGTGIQGRSAWPGLDQHHAFAEAPPRYVAEPAKFAINSPWALHVHEDSLFIAMAGPHQIWKMTLDEKEIGPYAGNGREDIVDGPLLPEYPYQEGFSSFAQPSGLASDGQWLYIADCEGSSIRAVPFSENGKVKTIVGTSALPFNRLFVFGDRDGVGPMELTVPEFEWRGRVSQTSGVALQHCLGVVHHEGILYLADTYNDAIKMLDLESQECITIAGGIAKKVEE